MRPCPRLSWLRPRRGFDAGRARSSASAPDDQIHAALDRICMRQGEALLAAGKFVEADDAFETALAVDPRNRAAFVGMARVAAASRSCSARRSASPTRRWRWSRTTSTRWRSRARRWSSSARSPRARDNLAKLQKLCPKRLPAGDRACRRRSAAGRASPRSSRRPAPRPTSSAALATATNSATLSVSARRSVSMPSVASASSAPGMRLQARAEHLAALAEGGRGQPFEHRVRRRRRASRAGTMWTTAVVTLGGGTKDERWTSIAMLRLARHWAATDSRP